MTLLDLIRETRARLRTDSARDVHDAITRPQLVRKPRTVTLPKDGATLTWERLALAEIEGFLLAVTGDGSKALERISALNSLQMLAAVRNVKKSKPEKEAEINARSDALVLLYLDAVRKGYEWPLPSHFGQADKVIDSFVDEPSPSLFATAFPDNPAPTMEEVAAMMTEPEGA